MESVQVGRGDGSGIPFDRSDQQGVRLSWPPKDGLVSVEMPSPQNMTGWGGGGAYTDLVIKAEADSKCAKELQDNWHSAMDQRDSNRPDFKRVIKVQAEGLVAEISGAWVREFDHADQDFNDPSAPLMTFKLSVDQVSVKV